ncbi:MAG: EAL domain-containing protein [Ilumatobacteraceae bacterium]|nr:EAL domain-containing protein [Ilumatobacter sp.]MCB0984331.1 EAL domain-containing protein [Ilumatobacter sp.]
MGQQRPAGWEDHPGQGVSAALSDRARLRSTLDNLVDPCVLLLPVRDEIGRITDLSFADANHAACDSIGQPLDALLHLPLMALPTSGPLADLLDRHGPALAAGEAVRLDRFHYRSDVPGAKELYLDVRAVPVGEAISVSWRDVTVEEALHRSLEDSERRYRLLAEHGSDVVAEVDIHGRFMWISPSAPSVAGWLPESLIGEDVAVFLDDFEQNRAREIRSRLLRNEVVEPTEMLVRTAAGDERWMLVRAEPLRDSDGRPAGVVLGLRDCHAEVMARRAANTLSAGSVALVRATDEDELLRAMCATAIDHGGYRYAWYVRRVNDAARTVRLVAEAGDRGGLEPEDGVRWSDTDERGFGPTGTALRTGRAANIDHLPIARAASTWNDLRNGAGFRSALSLPVVVDGELDGALTVYSSEPGAFDRATTAVLSDLADQVGIGLHRLRTTAALQAALARHELLRAAIDQSADAIVITDPAAAIMYANPAAARSTGYSPEELVGQNPRMFQSGVHDPTFYLSMWSRLTAGQSFHGTLVNRRKSGELYEEEATITPVHDGTGSIMAYVGVKRELGRAERLVASIDQEHNDRETLLDLMRDLRPADTFEGTATLLCQVATRLDGIDGATLLQFKDGRVVPIGMTTQHPGVPLETGAAIPVMDVALLIEATERGAWWVDLHDLDGPAAQFPDMAGALRAAGFHATAYVPVRWDGEMIAALSVVTSSPHTERWIGTRLRVLEEFAAFAGALLGEQSKRRDQAAKARQDIADIIRHRRFRPVFQPIIATSDDSVRGYEALTRFDDGVAPDVRIDEAHRVGLGSELERACVEAAIEAAAGVPDDIWLSVNFTPTAILDGTAATVVRAASRPLVLEITEQLGVESYPIARKAILQCRPAKVSVDDAGAGFASLRHIIELEPDMVKLDMGLVHNIDADPARQAIVAGLVHFADLTGTQLIAEGVERCEEGDALAALGVRLAQGYCYGRPGPLPDGLARVLTPGGG